MPPILIIEDEKAMRLLVQDYLEFLGYRVLAAEDGAAALALAATEPFALAFVDINLPDMSGVEVMRRLRARGIESKLVILSGNLRESYADAIVSLDVSEVLEKPVDLDRIEDLLTELVGTP